MRPPAGMHDSLEPRSVQERWSANRLVDFFRRHGFVLVSTPLLESAQLYNSNTQDHQEKALRLVDPEDGDLVVLRADVTPQIARLSATRLQGKPKPWNLCYDATIVRPDQGRTKRRREIRQIGVERIGEHSAANGGEQTARIDAELMILAAKSCENAGLGSYRMELYDVGIGRKLLAKLPNRYREEAREALGRKDTARLKSFAQYLGGDFGKSLLALPELFGALDGTIKQAERFLSLELFEPSLTHLKKVAHELQTAGLCGSLGIDLGEVRGGSYYTGASFSILGHGPGDAIAKGGRYDGLLQHYGTDAPATGFAINTHHLQWALAKQQANQLSGLEEKRIALSGFDLPSLKHFAEHLRGLGASVCVLQDLEAADVRAYAKAWEFNGTIHLEQTEALLETRDGSRTRLSLPVSDAGLADWLQTISH